MASDASGMADAVIGSRSDGGIRMSFRSIGGITMLFALLLGIMTLAAELLSFDFSLAVVLSLLVLTVQFLIGPWILERFFRIRWDIETFVTPNLLEWVESTCATEGLPLPKLGVIEDGTPNAFTYGRFRKNARVVVTTGLLDILDSDEQRAVIAHELGHIKHWDFAVMTILAIVPMLLHWLYRTMLRSQRGSRNDRGGYVALVGLAAMVAYFLSQYIVLFVSRAREYLADAFAGRVTGKPNALSSALIRIAYGLAMYRSARTHESDAESRLVSGQAMGIFNLAAATHLAIVTAHPNKTTDEIPADVLQQAMRHDLANPFAWIHELASTHPLPAKRIRALNDQAKSMGQQPLHDVTTDVRTPWGTVIQDLTVLISPWVGAVAVTIIGALGGPAALGGGLIGLGALMGYIANRKYPLKGFAPITVRNLLGAFVTPVRPVRAIVEGTIVGRGVPGLFYSEDFVMHDDTGYLHLDYRQPLGLLTFLFGWRRAEKYVGQKLRVTGWYRRTTTPFLEIYKVESTSGKVLFRCYTHSVQRGIAWVLVLLGVAAINVALW